MAFMELIAGANWVSILLFVVGIGLLVAEMFDPGFGIFGIGGVLSLVACIFVTAQTVTEGIMLTGVFFVIILVMFGIFLALVSKGKLPQRLILKESESADEGFTGVKDLTYLKGQTGVVTAMCRPVGCIEIDGRKIDVVTQGEFVEKGQTVEIIEIEGNRIVVKASSQS